MLTDAGFGLKLAGRLYDTPLSLRLDVPVYMSRPDLAPGRPLPSNSVAPRLVISTTDFWA